jgi:hypothetical protein
MAPGWMVAAASFYSLVIVPGVPLALHSGL